MLADLPVGAVFSFACRVTGPGTFDLLSRDRQVRATLVLDPNTLAVTGQLAQPPNLTPVEVVSAPFNVGDIVVDAKGAAYVVRDTWLGSNGFCWSNTTNRGSVYTTAGFTKVGTATFQ